ncbi:MAG TPA: nickel-dependent hydrogenase large subunit, partial [Oscillatoriaceae cyanobacterium]
IEPGHFRFAVDGEHVIQLEARLFWTHKGTEKLFEGRTPQAGALLAERVCGACSVANSLAFCQALEAIAGVTPSERAQLIRVVAAELERLYNHAGDVAGILTDVAYAGGAAHLMQLRERLLQLNEAFAGNRLLMGMNVPGGVKWDLSPDLVARLGELAGIQRAFDELVALATADESVLDRLETTGRLTRQVVDELGVVGPAARAAGVRHDVRKDHPYAAYGRLGFELAIAEKGDVLARLRVKQAEFAQSVALIRSAIRQLPEGPLAAPLGILGAGSALGWAEGPRGETLVWVETTADGRLARVKVRSASYMNWPAVPQAVLGNIVPDFPLINKSFNLCYSCTDR